MFSRLILLVATFGLILPLCSAVAQTMGNMPMEEHAPQGHVHPAAPDEKLGTVSFPTSCAAPSRTGMERGIALLHSFAYATALMQFEALTKSDPRCAMAHWGVAMTQFQEIWDQPDAAQLKRGAAEMALARTLAAPPAKITQRERDYIDALNSFFEPAAATFETRVTSYQSRMDALHRAYPADTEAAAFDALAILASIPPGDTSLSHEHQAIAILVPLFKKHPNHPGLAHYIIHTCDTPALAPEGLSAAREYAAIAPSSPHALHMPGHIFARLGMWPEDISSNLASVHASEQAMAAGQPGGAHQLHAEEFLIYAYLQTGQDAKAKALTDQLPIIGMHLSSMPGMDDMKDEGPFFSSYLVAIYNLEMHDWKAAAALMPAAGSTAKDSWLIYWANGIGAGHLHDATAVAAAIAKLDKVGDAFKQANTFAYYETALKIERTELLGWQAYAEDQPRQAITFMHEAADIQDKRGQAETDIPSREMLADLLMLEHQPAEALAEYRRTLQLSPNRLNALLGAGPAAEQAGQPDQALPFLRKVSAQTDGGHESNRAEVHEAMQNLNTAVAGSTVGAR